MEDVDVVPVEPVHGVRLDDSATVPVGTQQHRDRFAAAGAGL